MSFEPLPSNLEQDVRQFASRQHISRDEAVIKLIETGLHVTKPKSPIEQGLGLFGSPEDAALLDEVVSMAYKERRRPTKSPVVRANAMRTGFVL